MIYGVCETLCVIWNNLHNLKNMKNTHGGVLLYLSVTFNNIKKLDINHKSHYFTKYENYIKSSSAGKIRKLVSCILY